MRQDRHGNALPHRLHAKGDAYYYVKRIEGKPKWTALGSDYAEALRKWAVLEGGGLNASTLGEVAAAYSVDAEGLTVLSKATQRAYTNAMKAFLPVFGHMALTDIEPTHLAAYRRSRTAKQACNQELMVMGILYRYARNQGWWDKLEAPSDGVKRNPKKPREVTATESEVAALLLAASPLWRCVIEFALCTGWRATEIRTMRRSQIVETGVMAQRLKGGIPAIVAWSPALRRSVEDALSLQPKARPSIYVFPKRNGQVYTSTGWNWHYRSIRNAANCDRINFHDLRRTAATNCVDLEHARQLLGHSDQAITGKVYRQTLEVKAAR